MTIKTFLPMGEKPPDINGQGGKASTNQAPTVTSLPPFQQFPEEILASELLPPSSITLTLIVIIFSKSTTLANNFASPKQCHTIRPHRIPTTAVNLFNTTMIPTINITTNISIDTTDINTIDTFTVTPLPAAIVSHRAASTSNTTAPAAACAAITRARKNTTTDCPQLSIQFIIASTSTDDDEDPSTADCLLLANHLAAASIPTAAADTSTTTTHPISTTHLNTANVPTSTVANTSNTIALMFAIQIATTTMDEEYTTTAHLFFDLPSAVAKSCCYHYATTTFPVTLIHCMASGTFATTVTSRCIDTKLLLTHIMFLHLPRLPIIMFDPHKFHYYTRQLFYYPFY